MLLPLDQLGLINAAVIDATRLGEILRIDLRPNFLQLRRMSLGVYFGSSGAVTGFLQLLFQLHRALHQAVHHGLFDAFDIADFLAQLDVCL